RFAGLSPVADLGCGIGGDALALAGVAGRLLAVERNPVRLRFARHNLSVYNRARKTGFLQANILRLPARLPALAALFADPARRVPGGRRTFQPNRYTPPLSALLDAFARRPMGVKVGPGLDFAALPFEGEVEVVSLGGEVKEAVLWLGELATPGVRRRATLLPAGVTLTDALPAACPVGPLTGFLYEPDGAIIRAGLVEQAGARLGLHRLDPHIAYLCGDAPLQSPLVTGYRVEASLPLRWKAINRHLQAHGIARLNIKQRGTGLSPEGVAARLKPPREGVERTLILLRMGDEHRALICRRLGRGA
ncbi:MAG: class I SAM-dependent methyltransferase, partial [Caldilineae bacterium]